MAGHGFSLKFAFLVSGLIVWAAHFMIVYAINGLFCALRLAESAPWNFGIVSLGVIAATIVAVVLEVFILIAAARGWGPGISDEPNPATRQFWRSSVALLAGMSLVAVIWTATPIFIIHPCS